MTTLPQENTIIQYVADGMTTLYNFPFYIFLSTDIAVYVTLSGVTPNPDNDLQPNGVAYTVTGAGNPTYAGGSITFQPGYIPPSAAIVTIAQDIAFSINTQFSQVITFNGQNLDTALARIVTMCQNLSSFYNYRGIQYPIDSYVQADDPSIPNPVSPNIIPLLANGNIWMGQNGQVISVLLDQNPDFSTFASQLASETNLADGAGLVGYYDIVNNVGTTVRGFLNNLPTFLVDQNFITATELQSGEYITYLDTGSANAYVVTGVPAYPATLTLGYTVYVKVAHTNTGGSTIAFNGHSAINIVRPDGSTALNPSDMKIGMIAQLKYDGTNVQLMNPFDELITARFSLTGSVSVGNAATLVVPFNVTNFDTNGYWNGSTFRYTPLIPGYYEASTNILMAPAGTGYYVVATRLNGVTTASNLSYSGIIINQQVTDIILCNGTTDYIDFIITNNNGSGAALINTAVPIYATIKRLS